MHCLDGNRENRQFSECHYHGNDPVLRNDMNGADKQVVNNVKANLELRVVLVYLIKQIGICF